MKINDNFLAVLFGGLFWFLLLPLVVSHVWVLVALIGAVVFLGVGLLGYVYGHIQGMEDTFEEFTAEEQEAHDEGYRTGYGNGYRNGWDSCELNYEDDDKTPVLQ